MQINSTVLVRGALSVALLFLTACGGGGMPVGGGNGSGSGFGAGGGTGGGTSSGTGGGLTLTGSVSTFAGSATGVAGLTNGAGTAAMFSSPRGITTDGTNLYVADAVNNQIRQIVIATGAVTLLVGSPTGLPGSTNGVGTAALFSGPYDITTDGTNLYVVDTNNALIRQIVIATGVVTTLAGGAPGAWTNGTGTAASFNQPQGITTDGKNLYVSEWNNNDVRQIVIATGVVTTLAGGGTGGVSGLTNGTGTAALFQNLRGITTDGTSLYVVDTGNNEIRKIVIATAVVTTLAGSSTGASGLINGTGTAALFFSPWGITTDGTNLYVSEYLNNDIRQIVIATGVVTTLAGSATGASGLANGTGTAALFNIPAGITGAGTSLYVADSNNNEIRRIQ